MYGQRRGLSQGHNLSDNEARDANAGLMKTKRRQILLSQLSDKEELYKQYANPRGIGMRGQTVPQRDIDILYQQIEGIRQQIAALDGVQPSPTSAPPSVPPSAHTPYQQQPQQQGGNNNPFQQNLNQVPQSSGGMYSQPQTAGAAPMMGGGGGMHIGIQQAFPSQSSRAVSGRSLRDEAWNTKYQKWLARSQQQPMQQQQYMPSSQQHQPQQQGAFLQADFSNNNQFNDSKRFGNNMNSSVGGGVPPLHPQTNSSRGNINNQSGAFGYDSGQQQQQPQFGRRATPPNTGEFNPQRHPTPTNGMGTNDHQGSFGRRGSGRPW